MTTKRYRSSLAACSIAAALTLISGTVHADGSVSFTADIEPLLEARPVFKKFVDATFKVEDTGWGVRVGNEAMPHLGGARMGPYEFQALWHSRDGDVPITLVVDTDAKFFDSKGHEITNGELKDAFSLKETFTSIEIEPPKR